MCVSLARTRHAHTHTHIKKHEQLVDHASAVPGEEGLLDRSCPNVCVLVFFFNPVSPPNVFKMMRRKQNPSVNDIYFFCLFLFLLNVNKAAPSTQNASAFAYHKSGK